MSMINISGIPNMGFAGGGGGYFGGNASLGLPAIGAVGDFGASKFSQPLYNNIFGNFGQQTDYYSALGAAYGRATGGFGAPGSNPGWQAPASYDTNGYPSSGGGYGFDNSAYLNAMQSMMGGWGGGAMGSLFDQAGKSGSLGSMSPFGGYVPGMQPGAMDFSQLWGGRITPQPPAQNPWDSYFNDATAPATAQQPQGRSQTWQEALYGRNAYNPFDPSIYAPAVTGAPNTSNMPNLGYNPGMQNYFANPAMGGNPFLNAFSNFPNSATPSQYTYQPYTNAQGQTFQPNMPPGFAPLYGVDNPEGALPLKGQQGGQNWSSAAGGA